MSRCHGSYIGHVPEPTASAASGIWKACDAQELLLDGKWPSQPAVPGAPNGLPGNGMTILTWAALQTSPAVTDYGIQYSSNGGETWTTFTDSVSSATTATVTGLTNGTAYIFRLYGINALGDGPYGSASAPVTPVSNPVLGTSGLVAYFRAGVGVTSDGNNRVTAWADQSGNNNHATADEGEEPLYLASGIGGQPALDFDGGEILTIPHSSSINISTMSVFMVVKRDGEGTGNGFAMMRNNGRWGIALDINSSANWFVTSHSSSPTDFNSGYSMGSNPHLIGFTNSGTELFPYHDGLTGASLLARTFSTSSDPEGSLQIGGYDESFSGTEKCNAKIAEVMLFNRVLTTNEIDAIEAYVAGHYGITMA